MPTYILGVSAYFHDSAAAILRDGEILAAAQEERFTRIKHDAAFPTNAVRYCLNETGIELHDVQHIAYFEKPLLKFERLIETYLTSVPHGRKTFTVAMPSWIKGKLFQKSNMGKIFKSEFGDDQAGRRMLFAQHHDSHAASAFYPSPFEEAVVLTMDGVGEWATTSVSIGQGKDLRRVREIRFPHSLGLLYSAITGYLGFKVNSGEYKVMGLAPYGEPRFASLMEDKLISIADDGSFWLDTRYFDYVTGLRMTNKAFHDLFGALPRDSESELTQFHFDMAASIQKVTENVMLRMTRALHSEFGIDNLCMAGGVALNCVANGEILRDGRFRNVWIQPAAGDAGGALGAALLAHHRYLDADRIAPANRDAMRGSYLGPAYSQDEINAALTSAGAVFDVVDEDTMIETTADALDAGMVIGWFQGRMEFGPRALGGRSIIADPRNPKTQRNLNLKIKFRESFRPFAPSVLAEDASDYFQMDGDSPYMLLVADVVESLRLKTSRETSSRIGIERVNETRSTLPAITHLDYSARVQTVHADTNPLYHKLLSAFKRKTGCAVVVNTSFNVRGEPIVESPLDAFRCLMGTEVDMLICGHAILRKAAQNPTLALDYKNAFTLD
jgi:carbamoyltransferase